MKTVGDLRRENLELLVEQFGTLEGVASAVGSTSIYLSQVRNQAIDAKTGKPREMGALMARRLEAAAEKPRGWMDQEHGGATRPRAATPPVAGAPTPDLALRLANAFADLPDQRADGQTKAKLYNKLMGSIEHWRTGGSKAGAHELPPEPSPAPAPKRRTRGAKAHGS